LTPANEIVRGQTKLAMLIRRAAYERVGALDETIRTPSMIEGPGRARLHGLRNVMLEEVVGLRRLHLANGRRRNAKAQDDETLLALKRVMEARLSRLQRL